MTAEKPKKHPAKFSLPILHVLDAWIRAEAFWLDKRLDRVRVLDPMAGCGLVHRLPGRTFGIEIEPEWAEQHPRTQVGDALDLPWRRNSFDIVATSCTYGNRFADHHNAKDGSERRSYTHDLGRALHPNNSGQLHWGKEYRIFHMLAWGEVRRVLRPGGLFILNISDHVRKKEIVPVAMWHAESLVQVFDFELIARRDVSTSRMRKGQNHAARVEHEHVFAFRAPPT